MNIAFESRRTDAHPELLIQILDEAMDEMVGRGIGLVDERVMADHRADFRVVFAQRSQVRVMFPQGRAGCPHVREKPARVGAMQIADGSREHDYIPRREPVLKDPLFHDETERPGLDRAVRIPGCPPDRGWRYES